MISGEIGFDELGLIIEHFLEMRDVPLVIYRVTMEAAAEMVMDTACGHLLERKRRHLDGALAFF